MRFSAPNCSGLGGPAPASPFQAEGSGGARGRWEQLGTAGRPRDDDHPPHTSQPWVPKLEWRLHRAQHHNLAGCPPPSLKPVDILL